MWQLIADHRGRTTEGDPHKVLSDKLGEVSAVTQAALVRAFAEFDRVKGNPDAAGGTAASPQEQAA